jgi:hypothetical protein
VQTWVNLPFADGTYRFALGLAQISEIEKKCGDGIGAIYARTARGRYGIHDGDILPEAAEYRFGELLEVITQALVGGASGSVRGEDVRVSSIRADELVSRYIAQATDQRMAMTQTWALAYRVLDALVHGYSPPKDQPGEGPAAPATD